MKVGINIRIDVTKIDKSRIFEGKKGKYLDLTTFIDTENADQYDNNGFISQSQTKEEREANAPHTPILGNCKVFFKEAISSQQYQQTQQQAAPKPDPVADNSFDDDIPF